MEIICIKSKFLRNLFDQNTYIIKNNNNAIIIDAGAEVEDVMSALNGAKVHAILMTHLHFDHIWNIDKYISAFGCKVFVCEGAEIKFFDHTKNGSTMMKQIEIKKDIKPENIGFYKDGTLQFEDIVVEVFKTPGHAFDSVCLKVEKALFSGDTIFADAIGRTDLYDSSNEDMQKSLKLIKNIDFDILYPGHYGSAPKWRAVDVIDYYLN